MAELFSSVGGMVTDDHTELRCITVSARHRMPAAASLAAGRCTHSDLHPHAHPFCHRSPGRLPCRSVCPQQANACCCDCLIGVPISRVAPDLHATCSSFSSSRLATLARGRHCRICDNYELLVRGIRRYANNETRKMHNNCLLTYFGSLNTTPRKGRGTRCAVE